VRLRFVAAREANLDLGRWAGLALGAATLAMAGLVTPAAADTTLEPIGTYSQPVYVTSDPDDHERLFVVERLGWIQLTTPEGTSEFVDLTSVVTSGPGNERGLLSVAFPPDHAATGLLYVFYTGSGGALTVAELRSDGDTADPASLRVVLTIPHPQFANHNGGQLQFGADGYLYVSTGDGGSGGDPDGNGQDPTTLLGAILRIDPRQNGSEPYSIPASNPYFGTANDPVPGTRDEIWGWGLRNPWRFSFDRETGALVIGDVGQGQREEIDYRPASVGAGRGDNFGWNCREGSIAYPAPSQPCPAPEAFVDPVLDYAHAGGACSITGGYVVRDPSLTDLGGRYLYADYCVGQLRSVELGLPVASGDRAEGLTVTSPVSFGEDACGRVYVASLAGTVSRLVGDSPASCHGPPEDMEPPATTLLLNGEPPLPFYRGHSLELTLEADDGPEGSGVAGIEYRLDGGEWIEYRDGFPVFLPGGEHLLEYRSRDRAGNVEATREHAFTFEEVGDPPPRLSAAVAPRKKATRVGRRARFQVTVANDPGAAFEATGVRVCAEPPRRRVRLIGQRCKSLPVLAPGAGATRAFTLSPKRRARARKVRVPFVARAPGLDRARAVATLKVKR
jgi:glucose/arabinose dehydrogenase